MAEENIQTSSAHSSGLPVVAAANGYPNAVQEPSAAPVPVAPRRERQASPEPKDNLREVVETVVFVVVLVLLLKSFVAEAFVIPTGSMAETLWGYQKIVECPKCRHQFPVNCSSEVEPTDPKGRTEVTGAICPNCRYDITFAQDGIDPAWKSGDRVLVSKFMYDTLAPPVRFDVVVFKFPDEPQKNYIPMNYIKRLIGLPGETIAVYYGDLYVTRDLQYEDKARPSDPEQQRHRDAMYENDRDATELFITQVENQFEKAANGKKFEIIRKGPREILAVRRLVYDNDCQPADLKGSWPPRWQPQADAWSVDDSLQPRHFEHKGGPEDDLHWLHYRHITRNSKEPELITDFMGYNTGHPHRFPRSNWVGDLILECDVTIAGPQGELVLDLAKGVDRFQARWDLATGNCALVRRQRGHDEVLATKPTDLKKKGTYRLRFADVDERLCVWVDGDLPFGDGVTYRPARERGPYENDLQPAGVGVRGGVTVDHLKLWRDTYYTTARGSDPSGADADGGEDWAYDSDAWRDRSKWEPLRALPVKTMFVQPDHFLCMGDNSPESSDSRQWGLVPRRLMLGRALLVYWPYNRAGPIR